MSSTVIDLYFRFFSSSSILQYLNVIVEVISIDGYYGVYVRPLRRHVYAHIWWEWPSFRRALARADTLPPLSKNPGYAPGVNNYFTFKHTMI